MPSSAHAVEPRFGQRYKCFSSDASKNGTFVWTEQARFNPGFLLIRGFESYNSQPAYKADWAKPMNQTNGTTIWEYTLPNVAQCTKVTVHPGGAVIFFEQCSDVSTRFCMIGY